MCLDLVALMRWIGCRNGRGFGSSNELLESIDAKLRCFSIISRLKLLERILFFFFFKRSFRKLLSLLLLLLLLLLFINRSVLILAKLYAMQTCD